MPTQIGSQQLRSSSAHCARKLAKRLATSWEGGSGRGSDADMVEEKLEEEEEEAEEEEEKEEEENSSDQI